MSILRWLRAHEPLWMVAGAAAILDAVAQFVPAVPDSWHPAVDIVLAVLTVLAGRALVISPATAARSWTTVVGPNGPGLVSPEALAQAQAEQVLREHPKPPTEPAP